MTTSVKSKEPKENPVFGYVTERFVTSLNEGIIPWRKTWNGDYPKNYVSEKEYSGTNLMLLPKPGYYLTPKQINRLGGKIKKGAKGNFAVYFDIQEYKKYTEVFISEAEFNALPPEKKKHVKTNENGQKLLCEYVPAERRNLRYYYLYHWEDTEGIPEKPWKREVKGEPNDLAEEILKNCVIKVDFGYSKCSYFPALDEIRMAGKSQFESMEEFYSVFFHEYTHGTGHKTRLNRKGIQEVSFGSETYSYEELVAEIGSAMLSGHCGFLDSTIDNSISYVQGWAKKLGSNPQWIVKASGEAQRAVKFILTGELPQYEYGIH